MAQMFGNIAGIGTLARHSLPHLHSPMISKPIRAIYSAIFALANQFPTIVLDGGDRALK
jgi:hypothetical protein